MSAETRASPPDLARRMESTIRFGTVAAVRHKHPSRLRLRSGGLLTQWLPWFSLRAGKTRDWDPPTVGEQGILFCPSGEPAAGTVLVGLNSDAHPQPSDDPNECLREYPDSAVFSYRHDIGMWHIFGIRDALIEAAENVAVTARAAYVETSDEATIASGGQVTIRAAENVAIDTPETHVSGDMHIAGDLYVGGHIRHGKGIGALGGGESIHDGDLRVRGKLTAEQRFSYEAGAVGYATRADYDARHQEGDDIENGIVTYAEHLPPEHPITTHGDSRQHGTARVKQLVADEAISLDGVPVTPAPEGKGGGE